MTVLVLQILVLCRTQIFRVSNEYERRFLSIFEHEQFWIVTKKYNVVAIYAILLLFWEKKYFT